MDGFFSLRFVASDKKDDELRTIGTRSFAFRGNTPPRSLDRGERTFNSDESAARFYLRRLIETDSRPAVRGLTNVYRAEALPEMRFVRVDDSPLTKTRLVRFVQTKSSIPIFGSQALVELDEKREFVSSDGDVAEIREVSPVASLSPAEALEKIKKNGSPVSAEALNGLEAPELTFFYNTAKKTWHLAYFFKKIPIVPADFLEGHNEMKSQGHGFGKSPRQLHPKFNYLIDAQDGEILLCYSATPMIDIPSKCSGIDEDNAPQDFLGLKNANGFEMSDPLRAIKTYDHHLKDIAKEPLPTTPIQGAGTDWKNTNRAAVSAHVNATRVFNFYKSVLMRDGVDDRGMDLVSIVNCTYAEDAAQGGLRYPQWGNAVWDDNKMWYGQTQADGASLQSFSRFLDVIAHELTHGVTQYTSDLAYLNQSGALNESFSDIFGIIIKNWYIVGQDSEVDKWDWEIGAGLGKGGLPLRDMRNPKKTGDPDHMDNFLDVPNTPRYDYGGVHTNSNIHNKAAYNVLTAKDPGGNPVFPPREAALLYYICLTRLSRLATFSEALGVLISVAKVYYIGKPDLLDRIKCIEEAYGRVGITQT